MAVQIITAPSKYFDAFGKTSLQRQRLSYLTSHHRINYYIQLQTYLTQDTASYIRIRESTWYTGMQGQSTDDTVIISDGRRGCGRNFSGASHTATVNESKRKEAVTV